MQLVAVSGAPTDDSPAEHGPGRPGKPSRACLRAESVPPQAPHLFQTLSVCKM